MKLIIANELDRYHDSELDHYHENRDDRKSKIMEKFVDIFYNILTAIIL